MEALVYGRPSAGVSGPALKFGGHYWLDAKEPGRLAHLVCGTPPGTLEHVERAICRVVCHGAVRTSVPLARACARCLDLVERQG